MSCPRHALPTFLLSVTLASALAQVGCGSRERPTGPVAQVDPVTMLVLEPQENELVGADSMRAVVVQALGAVTAIEFIMKRNSVPDTFARERMEFGRTQNGISIRFDVRIPALLTGAKLVIRGVGEDRMGRFFYSEPVVVEVIECDLFPSECVRE